MNRSELKQFQRMMMDKQTINMANYIREHMFRAHRGAIVQPPEKFIIAFGNDDYTNDNRSKAEVALLRAGLEGRTDIEEIGFAVDDDGDGYTWALVLKVRRKAELESLREWVIDTLWAGWCPGNPDGFESVQRSIAWGVVSGHEFRAAKKQTAAA